VGGVPAAGRPDFASVNVAEPDFADLVAVLSEAGIGVEAGVRSAGDAETLADLATPGVTRVLVELVDPSAGDPVPAAERILARLDRLAVPGPRLLHGEQAACWPLVAHAGRLGLPTRIGLEDTLTGPAGEPVPDNAELVRRALAVWQAAAPRRQRPATA
jgi:uncharacterized protein (DUF849 family)